MSSRALRRLQQDATIIKVSGGALESSEDDQPGFARSKPGKKKTAATTAAASITNPFAGLLDDADDEQESDPKSAGAEEPGSHDTKEESHDPGGHISSARKKKKKKKKHRHSSQSEEIQDQGGGVEEVDAAVKEVNELLGEAGGKVPSGATATTVHRSLLSVERRFLNAENEMKKIFGSRVVRAEAGRQRAHRRSHHRQALFAMPKDTWPRMDKPGLSMELSENKDGFQYFVFKHSQEYRKVQYQFLEAVETFDPNSIGAVLHAHPYHIDSLLQLSEVCKMSEDLQMATELLERALYCFECNFHTLFNIALGNCRLNYSIAENRPFYIALFRHLYYIGRKGCHRTALEFCKLLLSLDPEGDPLCILLMVDYYALRAGEQAYLLDLFKEWETKRNLSQLPNFAFSIPLALFQKYSLESSPENKKEKETEGELASMMADANLKLQDALLMFPNVLVPMMDKCGVTFDPAMTNHPYFNKWSLNRDPKPLQLLLKLFVERNHSLWRIPEVLTWLEENVRMVMARVDSKDPLVDEYKEKRERRYVGTPRNIYRHVVMSDYDQITATLPRDLSDSGIMMYDPLPPLDSTTSYTRPSQAAGAESEGENPLLLFLRSMLPTFENLAEEPIGAGGLPLPPRQRLQAQFARHRQQGQQAAALGGGEGGVAPVGVEGDPGQPLDLQSSLNELVGMFQRVLDLVPTATREGDSNGRDTSSSDEQ